MKDEEINDNLNYSEYLAENLDTTLDYSEYLAEAIGESEEAKSRRLSKERIEKINIFLESQK